MSRRIDIELTSSRDDGTWTWRAAGAKQPKGVLDGAILYPGAKVGEVVRAEADFELEGITVLSVIPPKGKRSEPERLEIIGPPRVETPGVTTSLVSKGERGGREGRRPPRDGDRDRGDGSRRPKERADRGPRREGAERRPGDRAARPDRGARPERTRRAERPARAQSDEAPAKAKPKRLSPGNVHRNAVLADLAPEQRAIAEQVLKGGLPAVRQAVHTHNVQAKADNQPELPEGPIVAMAEELLPRLKAADWRDRAEAAAKDVDEIALRDLRSVVAGAEAVARDDDTRLLASQLREALERRVKEHRERWVAEIIGALDEGRLVRALRVSARPPDAGSRFPAELAVRLGQEAGAAMGPDTAPERWAALLEAVADSPVRRTVKPAGLPAEPGEALLHVARQSSGKVPALAALLGIEMPPPPGPPRARPPRPPRPPKPAGRKPTPPQPKTETPPQPEPAAASAEAGPGRDQPTPEVEAPLAPPPEAATPGEDASAPEVEQVEDLSGTPQDEIVVDGDGAPVPAGESETSA